jgi:spermidine synthase
MARIMRLPAQRIRHLRAAVGFEPERASLRLQLAWVLATCEDASLRDGAEAVRLASDLARETGRRDPGVLDTLAAALAADGRYDEAVVAAAEARDLALRRGDEPLARALEERLALYRSHRGYVQTTADASA